MLNLTFIIVGAAASGFGYGLGRLHEEWRRKAAVREKCKAVADAVRLADATRKIVNTKTWNRIVREYTRLEVEGK